jgi:nicotinamide riboside kinase
MFVDSDAVVTQYYLNKYHGVKSDFIDAIIKKQNYDYVFYLEPNVKWVSDGYRFLEKSRLDDNEQLKAMYDCKLIPITSSDYNTRFLDIIKALSLSTS